MSKFGTYIKESNKELIHKVSWPTREEVSDSTGIVIIASLIIALVIFLMDALFEWFLKFLYGVL